MICPIPAHNNTADTQATYTPPAPRWRAYRQAQHLQHIPDTTATPGHCAGQHRQPIIIMYIRAHRCPLLWIHARQCSISQTMPARRGQLLLCVDRWQVLHPAHLLRGQRLHLYRVSPAVCCPALMDREQTQQRAGGAIDGYRRISFRAFAR